MLPTLGGAGVAGGVIDFASPSAHRCCRLSVPVRSSFEIPDRSDEEPAPILAEEFCPQI